MTSRARAIADSQTRINAHELGAQYANEVIFRAILQALSKTPGTDGAKLLTDMQAEVLAKISQVDLGADEHTEVMHKSANTVIDSVFADLLKS